MDKFYDVAVGLHSVELFEKIKQAFKSGRLLIVGSSSAISNLKILDQAQGQIPKDVVLGVFTSGTLSGKPRLILYSKKNIEASLQSIRALFNVKKIDQIFCYPQPSHTFGLTLGYVQAALFDVPLTFFDGQYGQQAHELWFKKQTPGLLTLGAPVHMLDLMSWVQNNNLSPMKTYSSIVGGAPTSRKLWQEMVDVLKIENPSVGYGATEASPGITHLPPGQKPTEDGDIGQLLNDVVLKERSDEGFIFSGPNVCAVILDENGLLLPTDIKISDCLIQRSDGHFTFSGRSDLIINRGGIKISPEFIESQIFSETGLRAVCLGIFDSRLGEDLGFVIQAQTCDDFHAILFEKIQGLVKDKFEIKIDQGKVFFGEIPLNASAKYDRVEALKLVLRRMKLQKPMSVNYFRAFLPHRASSIWIQSIVDFKFRSGKGEAQLDPESPLFSDGELRETVCIELVAQTYAYSVAAYETFSDGKSLKANKTLIADIRNANFYFTPENRAMLKLATKQKMKLSIEANCTHDFGMFKVLNGKVFIETTVLAELELKVFVSA